MFSLSACAKESTLQSESPSQQVVEAPPDTIIELASAGWDGFVGNLTDFSALAATRQMLPEAVRSRNLVEATNEAKSSAGILAGEFPTDACAVVYLKRAADDRVGLGIATTTNGLHQQRVWQEVAGQEVSYYISKYC